MQTERRIMTDRERMLAIRQLLRSPFEGHSLTEKEKEAAELAASGYSQQEMAEHFGISIRAVQWRLDGACKKIGVASSKELTRYWVRLLRATAGL